MPVIMRKYWATAAFMLFLLCVWEIVVKLGIVPEYILPAPSSIIKSIIDTSALLWEHSLQTVREVVLGFLLAVALGIVLAVFMGIFPLVKQALYPLVVISQTIPIMAVAPLFIIWFGYGILPKLLVVTLVCFFPITVSLVEGFAAVDQDIIKLLQAMGASRRQILEKVSFPGALPSFFAGLKIAVTYSVMGAVIGEWLGASQGLGVYMTRSMNSFQTAQVFGSIVVITVLSLAFFGLVNLVARIVMPWYYQK
ncbi:MAG TPA: ABC transporter permease [Peptococcaceae bacterium]|jgi:ABC-type nitrate/sulfonate/bicarbonate transport system permease component|nr:ABC transporter permease [Clostridia bacterium]HOB82454.1 ABC transporter permease [Peptococcaceae bacterium]HQD53526.1 ABC transporter permease [Peptococcaceae bacterium]